MFVKLRSHKLLHSAMPSEPPTSEPSPSPQMQHCAADRPVRSQGGSPPPQPAAQASAPSEPCPSSSTTAVPPLLSKRSPRTAARPPLPPTRRDSSRRQASPTKAAHMSSERSDGSPENPPQLPHPHLPSTSAQQSPGQPDAPSSQGFVKVLQRSCVSLPSVTDATPPDSNNATAQKALPPSSAQQLPVQSQPGDSAGRVLLGLLQGSSGKVPVRNAAGQPATEGTSTNLPEAHQGTHAHHLPGDSAVITPPQSPAKATGQSPQTPSPSKRRTKHKKKAMTHQESALASQVAGKFYSAGSPKRNDRKWQPGGQASPGAGSHGRPQSAFPPVTSPPAADARTASQAFTAGPAGSPERNDRAWQSVGSATSQKGGHGPRQSDAFPPLASPPAAKAGTAPRASNAGPAGSPERQGRTGQSVGQAGSHSPPQSEAFPPLASSPAKAGTASQTPTAGPAGSIPWANPAPSPAKQTLASSQAGQAGPWPHKPGSAARMHPPSASEPAMSPVAPSSAKWDPRAAAASPLHGRKKNNRKQKTVPGPPQAAEDAAGSQAAPASTTNISPDTDAAWEPAAAPASDTRFTPERLAAEHAEKAKDQHPASTPSARRPQSYAEAARALVSPPQPAGPPPSSAQAGAVCPS